MSHFPIFIDLSGQTVLLVGNGPQILDKEEKLRPFGPKLLRRAVLTEEDLEPRPALVVIGDTVASLAAQFSGLCREKNIPVNVVDQPSLCTFFFPALLQRNDLTVAVSTGGKSPGFAAAVRNRLENALPARSGEILTWMEALRASLRGKHPNARSVLTAAAEQSLRLGRPLTEEELEVLFQPPEPSAK